MALRSSLFAGDPKLEAAAVSDPAHITPGASGPHVAKIQKALNRLDGAGLDEDGIYGSGTAAAVLAYKQARDIINRSYQTQADNIVGKMTIAAMDRELLAIPDPRVIIGRPDFQPVLAFSIAQSVAEPATAKFSAVVRGNPYVGSNAKVDPKFPMPPSVPPGHSYEVDVVVMPPLTGDDFIDLEITGVDANNGGALVRPAKIQRSTKIIVLGFQQTVPGNAGKLKIQASLNGKVLETSNGFSVCAHPVNITAFAPPVLDVDDLSGVGMFVKETIESDSGALSHLDQVEVSELVDPIVRNEPPFGGGSGFVNNSGYQKAIPGPGETMADRHVEPRPSAGPLGETVKVQVHMFLCKRCGIKDRPVPFSGFEVQHRVFHPKDASGKETKEFKHVVIKKSLKTGVRIPNTKTAINAEGGVVAGAGKDGLIRSKEHNPGPAP